jgi:uncharacterized repeat protein (TIGR02543 family)
MSIKQRCRRCCIVLLGFTTTAGAALNVSNGGFSNTNGLIQTHPNWFGGNAPAGWSNAVASDGFMVSSNAGGFVGFAANISSNRLWQNVGFPSVTGDVTLKFNLGTHSPGWVTWATVILGSTNGDVYAEYPFTTNTNQTLIAYVPSNTNLLVWVQRTDGWWSSPSLGNVSVAAGAPALAITNGSFSDTNQLSRRGDYTNWFNNVPAGWTTTNTSTEYSVNVTHPPTNYAANLNIGLLRQCAGTNSSAAVNSIVALTFDLGAFDSTPLSVAAVIANGTNAGRTVFASNTFTTLSNGHSLIATNVGAGEPVFVEFVKNAGSGPPKLDNATITATNRYLVQLDPIGGTVSPSNILVINGSTYSNLPTPTRELDTFGGWRSGLSNTLVTNSNTVKIRGPQLLRAQWIAAIYTVRFEAQGGSNPSPTNISVTNRSAYGSLPTTTRTGYTFTGWWTGTNGSGTLVTNGMMVELTGDRTLFAGWNANSYTITLDSQQGNSSSISPVTYNATYSNLPTPTRMNYAFAGWWTAPNGAGEQVTNATTVTTPIPPTLYAKWTYAVNFIPAAGGSTPTITSINVASNSTYGALPKTTRAGYTFKGWWTGPNGTGTEVASTNIVSNLAAHDLHAKWSALTNQVDFDSQGGSPPNPAPITVTFNSTYGTNLPTQTRSGYTFAGWWTGPNGAGTQVNSGTPVKITGPQTLYAKWVADVLSTMAVVNGEFSDTNGLPAFTSGWSGMAVPKGWSSTVLPNAFIVSSNASTSVPGFALNLGQQGSVWQQQLGSLASDATVTLKFDLLAYGSNQTNRVIVTMADSGSGRVFAESIFGNGTNQALTANVPACSPIVIKFRKTDSTWSSPALDNVSVVAVPTLRIANGDFSDTGGLSKINASWFDGVPSGWSTTSSNRAYSVCGFGQPTDFVANLGGRNWSQIAGTNSARASALVMLKFDIGTFDSPLEVNAIIANGTGTNRTVFAQSAFGVNNGHTLTAVVPAGSPVIVDFVRSSGTGWSPKLDNVSIASQPTMVANGDFSNTNGLTATNGTNFSGSPAAWSSSNTPSVVSIVTSSFTNLVGRLGATNTPLRQEIAQGRYDSCMTLLFDVGAFGTESATNPARLTARVTSGGGATERLLAQADYTAGKSQSLTAYIPPADAPVYIEFVRKSGSAVPWVDNVALVAGDASVDAAFKNPPNDYRIIQFSSHDGAALDVDKMTNYGIGGVKLFMQSSGYLTNANAWSNTIANINNVKAKGMQLWMADDNGYPSGQASGLVVASNNSYELQVLAHLMTNGSGTNSVVQIRRPTNSDMLLSARLFPATEAATNYQSPSGPKTVTNYVIDYSQGSDVALAADGTYAETRGRAGTWAFCVIARQTNNDAGSPAMHTTNGFGTTGHYPNLLDPAAMATLVNLTHDQYRAQLTNLAGKIDVFYGNEPNLGSRWHPADGAAEERPGGAEFVSWQTNLPATFSNTYGANLMTNLWHLFGGTNDAASLARRQYWQTVATTLATNYSGRIAAWAQSNNVRSGGHELQEESMIDHVINYGDLFEFAGKMQVPGFDYGVHGTNVTYDYMPKFLSSIARLAERKTVSCLLDPLLTTPTNRTMTPRVEDLRRAANEAFVLGGANQILTYVSWDATNYAPADYRALNEYIGRVSLLLRGADAASPVAMYYPIETFQARIVPVSAPGIPELWPQAFTDLARMVGRPAAICRALMDGGYNYSWLNAAAISSATIRNGRLVVGRHEYTDLIMPDVELLSPTVAEKLLDWQGKGGRVLWVTSLPRLSDGSDTNNLLPLIRSNATFIRYGDVIGQLGDAAPEGFRLRVTSNDFFIGRFTRDGRRLNYVVNKSTNAASFNFTLEGAGPDTVQVYNPVDGSITDVKMPASLTIPTASSLFIIEK